MLKGEKRRQDILDSAERLFYFQGYDQTSIEDILKELNCSKGSFYHHFESKMQVLEEISLARLKKGYEAFLSEMPEEPLEKLNLLLYRASPFGREEADYLSVMLSLYLKQEGAVILQRMDDMRRTLYYPQLEKTLEELRAAGLAHWREPMLPLLMWDAHVQFCHTLIRRVCDSMYTDDDVRLLCLNLLHAMRFRWERMLDIPFDSVKMISADSLMQALEAAWKRLKDLMPGESGLQTQLRGTRNTL